MAYEHAIARYRHWYAELLRFYPKPYRERFGEGMEQTFNDLCRERREAEGGLFGFVLWVFVETSTGIIKENLTYNYMKMIKLLVAVLAISFGVFMVVFGGYDDSPGGQILGLIAVIAGIVGGIKVWKKNPDSTKS